MNHHICYCGHDCSKCVTYIATQTDDDTLRKQSQKFYKELIGRDIPLEQFNCQGGRSNDIFEPCLECPFRKCCMKRNYTSCEECPGYPCRMLADYRARHVNKSNQIIVHNMNLVPSAFRKIADGSKTIELRLNDPKRRAIAVGDHIVFCNTETDEHLEVVVQARHEFATFEELYAALPLSKCGYTEDELSTAHPNDMHAYYTDEQIALHGVLGLEFCCL